MNTIIALPTDYVVVDLETTGTDYKNDKIIEISAIKFRNCKQLECFSQLIAIDQPLPKEIVELTGITDDMLVGCPTINVAIKQFDNFIGEAIIIGHNIVFDACFLVPAYELHLSKKFTNPLIDTLRIARKLLPQLDHHRLYDLAVFYGIPYIGAHRAAADCEITNECYCAMRSEILAYESEADFQSRFSARTNHRYDKYNTAKKISEFKPRTTTIDNSNPLYQKIIVFTGTLSYLTREAAIQIAIDRGAIVRTSVSKKTDYLIVGRQDISLVGLNGMSSKEEHAHEINRSGKAQITIMNEEEFLKLAQVEAF